MKTCISLVTQTNFGPWNIPARGQNFINTHYGKINSIEITNVVSEGIMFNNFKILENFVFEHKKEDVIIIFCSVLQLAELKDVKRRDFINFFGNYEIHFSLELISGKGNHFLNKIFEEISFFAKHSKINNNFKNYTEFYNSNKDIF